MTAKDLEQLRADIRADLPDNDARSIKAIHSRESMIDIIDSFDVLVNSGDVLIDTTDIKQYFQTEWNANYATWLGWAQNAWEDATDVFDPDYYHGNFILPAGFQVIEALVDEDPTYAAQLMDQVIAMTQAAIDRAVDDLTGCNDATMFGWGPSSTNPTRNPFATALSEQQWGSGAILLPEAILIGNTPSSTPTYDNTQLTNWATTTIQWIDRNITARWLDYMTPATTYLRYNHRNSIHNAVQASFNSTTGKWEYPGAGLGLNAVWNDKIFITLGLAYAAKNALGTTLADTDPNGLARPGPIYPDEWFHQFFHNPWHQELNFQGDCLIIDLFNPDNPQNAVPTVRCNDTLHANRMPRFLAHEFMRNGFKRMPVYICEGISNLVKKRIWNGRKDAGSVADSEPGILINNYIDGVTQTDDYNPFVEYDYFGNDHAISGKQGWGWIYNGWNQLGVWDPQIQRISQYLLDTVRAGNDVSATYGRHNTGYGRVGLAAGLLWVNYWRPKILG